MSHCQGNLRKAKKRLCSVKSFFPENGSLWEAWGTVIMLFKKKTCLLFIFSQKLLSTYLLLPRKFCKREKEREREHSRKNNAKGWNELFFWGRLQFVFLHMLLFWLCRLKYKTHWQKCFPAVCCSRSFSRGGGEGWTETVSIFTVLLANKCSHVIRWRVHCHREKFPLSVFILRKVEPFKTTCSKYFHRDQLFLTEKYEHIL